MAINDSIPFRKDLRITMPTATNRKCTLVIENGDIKTVSGKSKLVTQLLRAIINDNTLLKDLINTTSATERQFLTLMTVILRNFRDTQVDEVSEIDLDLTGYVIYRKSAGTSEAFEKVSRVPIVCTFTDTNLVNGIEYIYGIAKVFNGVFESSYVDSYYITPSYFESQQDLFIGKYSVIQAGDSSVTVYVNYNKHIAASELLNTILSIVPYQDTTDPRIWHVDIDVEDMNENTVGISSNSAAAE